MADNNLKIGANVQDSGFKKLQDTLKKSKKEAEDLGKSVRSINQEFKTLDKDIQNRSKALEKLANAFKTLRTAMLGTGVTNLGGINGPNSFNNGRGGGGSGIGGGAFNNGNNGINNVPGIGMGPPRQPPVPPSNTVFPPVNPNNWNQPRRVTDFRREESIWSKANTAFRIGGTMTDYLRDSHTMPEQGIAAIANIRNRMFDGLMGHNISDAAAFVYNNKQQGSLRRNQGSEMMDRWAQSGAAQVSKINEDLGKAVGKGFEKYLDGNKKMAEALGEDTRVQSFSALSDKTGVQDVAAFIQLGMGLAKAGGMGKAGSQAIAEGVDAVTGAVRHVNSFSSNVAAAQSADTMKETVKAINHQDIAMMQNFVNKAGMILQGDMRMRSGVNLMGRGVRAGMMGDEAISFGTGVADQFGQGMGNGLINFGIDRRLRGGNAGLMASLAGQAGFGIGGNENNEARTARGIKSITDAIALGVEKGMKDPQSMEALSQAIAGAISKYGGNGGLTAQFLTSGMTADTFNPLLIKERAQALGSFSGAEQSNPYFRTMGLADANTILGNRSDYTTTQALGGSLEELFAGGAESEALGITEDDRKQAIFSRIARVLKGASMGTGKSSERLRGMIGNAEGNEDIINNVINSQGGAELAAAITKGNFMGDFKSNFNMFQSMKLQGGAGSNLDLSKINTSGLAAQQTMANADIKFITELLGNKDKANTFKETLRAFAAMQEAMFKNPVPEGQEHSVTNVMKAIEGLVKTIVDSGGEGAVIKKIEEKADRIGRKK